MSIVVPWWGYLSSYKRFIMGDREKEYFVELMRNLAEFSGLRILTYSVLSNHFSHIAPMPPVGGCFRPPAA
jgi:REP element-mobilizing transposase RayT